MDQKTLWQQYQSLPDEVQQQVVDFLLFLQQKYSFAPSTAKPLPELANEPFVGMWRGRSEMNDSSVWVRNLRKDEWRDLND